MASVLRITRMTRLLNLPKYELSKIMQLSTQTSTESEENLEENLRKKILENSLKFVPEFGFTTEAITRGVAEAGMSSAATNGIFSHGAFDLIDFFYKKSNADLAEYLEGVVKEGSVTRKNELVRLALIHRLKLTQPYVKHWPQAMAQIASNPLYALTSIENLLRLCDEIWYQLGDDSVDFNWYTKRLTLAAIYKSTEMYMIQDNSENFLDTVRFLDNRLSDLGEFYKLKSQVSEVGSMVTGTLSVIKNVLNIRT